MLNLLEPTLQQLGLNENEIKVYLALLPLGTVPASVLGRRVGIPRSTAKYTCQQLVEKSLVTRGNKNNTILYTAKDPDSLHGLLEQEKVKLQQKELNLHRMIGNLKTLYNPHLVLPEVQFFEGVDHIKKMFEDVLHEQQPIYGAMRFDDGIHPEIIEYLHKVYIPRRKRLRNPAWMIFNDTPETREYQLNDENVNRISLLVPEKQFPFEVCVHIYGDKVAFYSYQKEDLTGVIIRNALIRTTQFSLFKLAWNYTRLLKANDQYKKVSL